MFHPVLPPEPPPIIEPLQAANLLVTAVGDRQLHSQSDRQLDSVGEQTSCSSCAGTDSKTQANTENPQEQKPATSSSTDKPLEQSAQPTKDELSVAKTLSTLSTPTTPETFPAEFSPHRMIENSATLLGEPLSVGYPLQQLQASGVRNENSIQTAKTEALPVKEQLTQPLHNSKNVSQKNSQLLTEQLIQGQQSENQQTFQPTPQPIKIQFDGNKQANASPQPSTIEFKTRSTTSQSPTQQQPPPAPNSPAAPPETRRVIEVIADSQEYDQNRRVVTAEGNVVVRFDGAVVDADRVQVNLDNLIAVGEGNVALTRGDQVLRGQRFTYNFIQDTGEMLAGRGEIFLPTAGQDFSFLPTDVTAGGVPARPPSDRIRSAQPLTGVGSPGGINVGVGGRTGARNLPSPQQGGQVRRLRFEAARIDFYPRGLQATDVSITNDPFSPPELVLRANKVTLTREAPQQDRVRTQGQRLVFDQGLSVPIPRDEQVIDRREREATPGLVSFGFDGDQRGGFFVERNFQPITTDNFSWSIAPQFYAQKTVQEGFSNIPSLFGLRTKLDAVLSPRSVVEGSGVLTSFDLTDIEDNLRASLRWRQLLGDVTAPHTLTVEYSYRDRLYNGSLGFQTVQSSFGGVLTSPIIPLGNTGLNLSYQGGAQYITANTDRQDLLETIRDNDRVSLGRLQASAAINGGVTLWRGKPLPPTATEGLRYTPNPVVPYLSAFGGVTGTTSYYSNGDDQTTLIGTVGLQGQLGHFSRSFLDYTAFNISYSQGINTGESPFLFDRAVDNRVLSAGLTQQIYGPFSLGFQTSVNLDTGENTSTDYILEYSRRTYGITLRYNPVLELGGISFRISDFNWTGGTDPFSDPAEVKPVVGGVEQGN
ncbi:MAG: DUF3769 domain-containing protein [Fischerella sp.]|uniref:DUF3769 domain-containing protein n=1 Tax=Fischerella sp. TaxID=1191 RepID=UPI00183B6949|nr:DUF3769 domain-containing protein [Fischerella sp.]NWF59414.1 DUF3769 domain-containing protein [Fischerella sp.]